MSNARVRRWGMLVAAATALSCRSEAPSAIQVRVGNAPEEHRSFVPQTALAEYLELPQSRSELRLTLTDYDATCDRFVPPGQDQAYVSVLVVTPAGTPISPGTYAWGGREAHGGSPSSPERPFAMPKALLSRQSHLFQPGGAVRLTKVALDLNASIEGVLAFEFPGDADHEATSLRGNFRAKICKINR